MVQPPPAGPRPATARTSSLGRRSRRPKKARGPTASGTLHGEPASGFMLEPYHAVAAWETDDVDDSALCRGAMPVADTGGR